MTKEAFIEIIQEHKKLIFKICNTYCQQAENRKDLEQEILLQLWSSIDRFNGRVKLSTWIYKVALNTAINFYKKDQVYLRQNNFSSSSIFLLPESGTEEIQDDRLVLLHQFINELSDTNKAIILLYLEGTKYREMSEILGISESNVATKINRIKKLLKAKFSMQTT